MKIAIILPVYKRPEVLKAILSRFNFPPSKLKIKLLFVFIVSPDDMYHDVNVNTIREFLLDTNQHGIIVDVQNYPVSNKQNEGIREALKHDWDYLMNLGSDDILSKDYWNAFWPKMYEGEQIVMMSAVCFMHPHSGKAVEAKFSMIGAGRVIRRNLIERTWRKIGYVYQPGMNSGMDTCSERTIRKVHPDLYVCRVEGSYAVDIKTNTNINLYQDITNTHHETTEINAEQFERYANLSELCAEITEQGRLYRGF